MNFIHGLFIGVTLFFGSLWSGTLGFLHISQTTSSATIATTTLDKWYEKDATNVYVLSPQSDIFSPIVGADSATFFLVPGGNVNESAEWAKDKNHVYDFGQVVSGANPTTFSVLSTNGLYASDGDHIFYSTADEYEGAYLIITGADASTFQIISGQKAYDAQDKNNKYLRGEIVEENSQTSATTTILDIQGRPSSYFKDAQHVYWNGSDDPNFKPLLISGYPNSFVPLSSHDLYSDGHQVFQEENLISNDAPHFELISSSTNADIVAKDSLYYYMGSHQSAQLTPTQHPEEWLNQGYNGGVGQ